jgi:succinate dehydrogenase / fumarate reductase cytochrome b subunit
MAKSALLKSSITKKYWMSLTGLFLCVFLIGHLAGNLQLLTGTALQFNEYALFMTTNPAVKILSYVTYISILFHAIDGILLTIQNRKARPIGYVKQDAGASSGFAARNMAVLGSLILIFIVIHLKNFWYEMHYCEEMPLMTKMVEQGGVKSYQLIGSKNSPMPILSLGDKQKIDDEFIKNVSIQTQGQYELKVDGAKLINKKDGEILFEGYKDLHKITFDFFRIEKNNMGLIFTILYVLSMIVLGFHLWHGFQSAFVSIGIRNKSWTPRIQLVGKSFAVLIPFLFAIIPLCIHFKIFVK